MRAVERAAIARISALCNLMPGVANLKLTRGWGSAKKVSLKKVSPFAIFHFNDPDVAIDARLARDVGIGFLLRNEGAIQQRNPQTVEIRAFQSSWRWPKESGCVIRPADFYDNGTGIVVTVPHHHRHGALPRAAPQIGLDPDF